MRQRLLSWWRATGDGSQHVNVTTATRLAALVALFVAAFEAVYLPIEAPTHGRRDERES